MLNFSTLPSAGLMAVMATSFLGIANAHIFIAEPKPLQGYSPKDPLDGSGSNFPCHGAPLPTSGGQKLTAGQSFPLKFDMGIVNGNATSTAVHGGGSCQLAILNDVTKAKDPNAWSVIYSVEKSCPAFAEGNLQDGYSVCGTISPKTGQMVTTECMNEFNIPVPKGVKSGAAILSWTWFNTIGNREMYQNCVNVDIEGGSGDGQFPPLFVANLESISNLHTTEGSDVLFPEPGQFVTTMKGNHPQATVGGGSGGAGGAPSSYSAPPAATSAPAYSAPPYSAPVSSAPAYSAPPSIQSDIASYDNQKGRETQTTFATSAAVTQSAVAAPSTAAPAPTGSSGSSNTSGSGTGSAAGCTPGAVGCNGPKQFGLYQDDCSIVWQDVAAGMACSNGAIVGAQRFRRHFHGAHKH